MAVGAQFTAADQARQLPRLCWVCAGLCSHGPGVGGKHVGAQDSFRVSLPSYSPLGHTQQIRYPHTLQGATISTASSCPASVLVMAWPPLRRPFILPILLFCCLSPPRFPQTSQQTPWCPFTRILEHLARLACLLCEIRSGQLFHGLLYLSQAQGWDVVGANKMGGG